MKNQENKIIKHISFIADGNRRYGKQHNLSEVEVYNLAFKKILEISENFGEDFEFLSFFCYSKHNNKRNSLNSFDPLDSLEANKLFTNFKCKIIGDIASLPEKNRLKIEKYQKTNSAIIDFKYSATIILFINYSGSYDIEYTFQTMRLNLENENLENKNLENENFSNILKHSLVAQLPPIDILIRTGKHRRLSDYSILLLLNSEIYFSEKLWPNLTIEDIIDILQYYKTNHFCFFGA